MGYQDGMNSGSSIVYHYIGFRVWNQVSPLRRVRRCTQHNGQGRDHSMALLCGIANSMHPMRRKAHHALMMRGLD
jgi:hypothetical protein